MNRIPIADSMKVLEERIEPLQKRLAAHPLYLSMWKLDHIRLFMETHVFAVWDFMTLLKALQRSLTCVDLPWIPTRSPMSRRFINEIVLAEESDEYEGRVVSHFEMYLSAMEELGADTKQIRRVVETASQGFTSVLFEHVPEMAREFVKTTFQIVRERSLAAQAAAFAFGREDVIPVMFRSLVKELDRDLKGNASKLVWYLERHIEVDGDDHGPIALKMVADLCGDDMMLWEEASQTAEQALEARLGLWDGVLDSIRSMDKLESQAC